MQQQSTIKMQLRNPERKHQAEQRPEQAGHVPTESRLLQSSVYL